MKNLKAKVEVPQEPKWVGHEADRPSYGADMRWTPCLKAELPVRGEGDRIINDKGMSRNPSGD